MSKLFKRVTRNFSLMATIGSLMFLYSCSDDEPVINSEKTNSMSIQEAARIMQPISESNISFFEVNKETAEKNKSSRTDEYYDYFIINQTETNWFYNNSDLLDDFWGKYIDVKIKHGGNDYNAYSFPSQAYIWFGEAFYRHLRYDIGGNGVAVTGMMAHEYAHQVQWRLGIGNYNYTLYNELQADALAGYYMGHQNGKDLDWSSVQHVADGQGSVAGGDHGNYNQRYNAVNLGYNIAKNSPNISMEEFKNQFDNWFY